MSAASDASAPTASLSVTITATDESGNTSTKTPQVTVPHDKK